MEIECDWLRTSGVNWFCIFGTHYWKANQRVAGGSTPALPIIYKATRSIIYHNRVMKDQQQTKTSTTKEDRQQSASTHTEKEANHTEKPLTTAAKPVDDRTYSKGTEAMAWYIERRLRHKSRHCSGVKTPTEDVHRSRHSSGRTDAQEMSQLRFSFHDYTYDGRPQESGTFGSAGAVPEQDCYSYFNSY